MGPGAGPRWDPERVHGGTRLFLVGHGAGPRWDPTERSLFPLKCALEAAGLFNEIVLEGKAGVSVVQEEVKCFGDLFLSQVGVANPEVLPLSRALVGMVELRGKPAVMEN